jgi:hypothetical protein
VNRKPPEPDDVAGLSDVFKIVDQKHTPKPIPRISEKEVRMSTTNIDGPISEPLLSTTKIDGPICRTC